MWVVCVSPLFLAVTEAEAAGPLRLMPADSGRHIACWTVMIQFRGNLCSPHYLLLCLLDVTSTPFRRRGDY